MSRRSFVKTAAVTTIGIGLLGPSILPGCKMRPPSIPRFYRPRYETLAHEILQIEAEHKEPAKHVDDNRLLDLLIEDARVRLLSLDADDGDPKKRARAMLRALSELLKGCGITYRRDGSLGRALRLGGANCDTVSSLFLAFGEVYGLPIKMVRAPGHTFIRWQLAKGEYINWETTVGQERTDAHYIAKHQIPDVAIGTSVMRSLDVRRDRSRILANAYVNSGVRWLAQCESELAIQRFLEAARRDPLYVSPCFNLGLTYFNSGDPKAAIIWCNQAVRLNPNHVKSHAVLVAAHERVGDRAAVHRHRREVERLDSDYYSMLKAHRGDAAPGICT